MTEYYLPTRYGTAEFVEKKSRFIGEIWPVSTEEEARQRVADVKKKYHDARHSCWCFLLRDGTIRYSDDGEPQGTAGQPMLEVFSRAGITDCVCVVTRYFGGVLLGTGGLVRAYTRSAKDALDAAGITVERLWDRLLVPCSYGQFEKVRQETQRHGGVIEDTDYGADIMLTVLTPEGSTQAYLEGLTELSAGTIEGEKLEQVFRGVAVKEPAAI
ncbi:MAG: YigZ family protein [Oscillospiraceae bacterium]|nr:YigZ family protein [Oscillospiraceae bacterium]